MNLIRPPFTRQIGPVLTTIATAFAVIAVPAPAFAQDDSEARLRRAEAEIRALQRAVFPGGDGRFFEPQIAASEGGANTTPTTNSPSTSAVTDILARLEAMEGQLQRLTALTEENANTLSGLEMRLTAVENAGTAPAQVDGMRGTNGVEAQMDVAPDVDAEAATDSNLAAMSGGASQPQTPGANEQEATRPSPERLAAVRAIAKPQTGDAGEDEYTYGFRLWNAGLYPEARQQLASYVEDYPNHFRVTYGRNLLGRAFLDDNLPEEAARWFLRNYQADRTARRAPDSLLYLAEAMIAMDDTRRACIALAEFGETYPAVATGRLSDQYEANRRRVNCQ